jgi:hypothetical protein
VQKGLHGTQKPSPMGLRITYNPAKQPFVICSEPPPPPPPPGRALKQPI